MLIAPFYFRMTFVCRDRLLVTTRYANYVRDECTGEARHFLPFPDAHDHWVVSSLHPGNPSVGMSLWLVRFLARPGKAGAWRRVFGRLGSPPPPSLCVFYC